MTLDAAIPEMVQRIHSDVDRRLHGPAADLDIGDHVLPACHLHRAPGAGDVRQAPRAASRPEGLSPSATVAE